VQEGNGVAIDGDYRAGTAAAQERSVSVRHAAADPAALAPQARDSGRALRLLGLVAVAVGLAALTAAACVLSYSSIHHLAADAGVTGQLARIYPLIFDALLVIAGCSVLALRGAGLPSRIYAWFCMLVLLGALAVGGAAHAAAVHIPRKQAAIVAAVTPWALVLIGFGLLLALLRYARIRRLGRLHSRADVSAALSGDAPPQARQPSTAAAHPIGPAAAGSPEPETRPLPTVPASHQHQAGGQPAGGQPVPELPTAGQPAPALQPRPTVRQAEMQLRARIPRQPPEQAQAQPVQSPLMPPVGPQPGRQQTNPRATDKQAAAERAAPDAAEQAYGAADRVRQPDETAEPGQAGQSGRLNPAPIDEQREQEKPPVLRRPHSSPTPPGD